MGHMAHLGGHLEGLQGFLQALGTHGVLLLADAGLGLGQLEQVHAGIHIGRGKLHFHLLALGRILAGRQLQVGLPTVLGRLLLQPGRGNDLRGCCGSVLPGRGFRPGGQGLLLGFLRLAGGTGGVFLLRITDAPCGGGGGGGVLPFLHGLRGTRGAGGRLLLRSGLLRPSLRLLLHGRLWRLETRLNRLGSLRLPAAENT